MQKITQTDKVASKLLGKKVESSKQYDPSILVAVPRDENRSQYGIESRDLPFCGYDVWHCYEFSVLTENSFPVTRVIKLKYSCDSEYIIESKSLKLYLNSYNMTKIGKNIEECLEICKSRIKADLSEKLNTDVELNFITSGQKRVEIFGDYQNLSDIVDEKDLIITEFKESPELLKVEEFEHQKRHYLYFDSLRSNCRVTHQPDFGDVYIYYKSKRFIDYNSLVKYLVSFRSENHFHEECCEMIFKRLNDLLYKDDELMVCALYTRRGGIDISPVRYSNNILPKEVDYLTDLNVFARSGIKQ